MAQQTPTVPAGSAAEHEAIVNLQLRTAAMAHHLEKERDGRAVASPVPERAVREWARADAGDFAKLRERVHDQVLPVMANNMRVNATYRSELEATAPLVAARVTAYDRETQAAFDAATVSRQATVPRPSAPALTADEVKSVKRIDERHHLMIESLHKGDRFSAQSLAKFAQSDARDFAMVSEGHKDATAIAVTMRSLGEHYPEYRAALAAASPQMAQRVEALHEANEAQAGARKPAAADTPALAAPQPAGKAADTTRTPQLDADIQRRGIDRWEVRANDVKPAEFKDAKSAAAAYDAIDAAKGPSVVRILRDGSVGVSAETVGIHGRREKSVGSSDQAFARAYAELQQQRQVERIDASAKTAASQAEPEGVRLASLGKGISTADIDAKTQQVVIRRSGRVVERLPDERAAGEFADKKGLSAEDRDALLKLVAARAADDPARDAAKASSGKDARPMNNMVNTLSQVAERGRVRAEVQQNDAQVYEWIERQRQLRAQQEPAAGQAGPAMRTVEGTQTIERQGALAAPDQARAMPPEVGLQFTKDGDKYYHQQSKAVAFVDRGDKLSTSASTPKMAEALVKVAEARGWDEVRVQGTEGFRREVWLEASSRGMHVDGYTPSDRDKNELEKRNAFTRDQNTIQVRSQAFQQLPPDQGVQRDPSLASAYALVQAAEAFAKARLAERDQQPFVTAVRAKVADDLQAGRPVPAVQIRAPARASARQVEHGNERVR